MVFASFLFRNAHFTFADFQILSKEKILLIEKIERN